MCSLLPDDFDKPPIAMVRRTPKTNTVSNCCNSAVSLLTDDDFFKVSKSDTRTLLMTIRYICNKCGKVCQVHEQVVDYKPTFWEKVLRAVKFVFGFHYCGKKYVR